jgi:hypothetical protein
VNNTKEIKGAQTTAEFNLYNIGAERAFVATLMARPAWVTDVVQQVPSDWLHNSGFRAVYLAMQRIAYAAVANGWGQPRFGIGSGRSELRVCSKTVRSATTSEQRWPQRSSPMGYICRRMFGRSWTGSRSR